MKAPHFVVELAAKFGCRKFYWILRITFHRFEGKNQCLCFDGITIYWHRNWGPIGGIKTLKQEEL